MKSKYIKHFSILFLLFIFLFMIGGAYADENITEDNSLNSDILSASADDAMLNSHKEDTVQVNNVENESILAASDNIFYVSPTGSSAGDGSRDNPYSLSSVSSHLVYGKSNEVILMDGTYDSGNFFINSKNLIIRSDDNANPLIKIGHNVRTYNKWDISGSNITIKGLTFKQDSMSYDLLILKSDITTVSNCTFIGAMENTNLIHATSANNITIEKTVFKKENAVMHSYSGRGIIFEKCNDVTVKDSSFSEFYRYNQAGNGVYVDSTKNAVFINNTFRNIRSTDGGAICSNKYAIKVINNTFLYCTATKSGGAVYVNGSNSVFINNTFFSCESTGGNGMQGGGAVFISYSTWNDGPGQTLFINNSFDSCKSSIYGGGIFLNRLSNVLIDNNSFINSKNYAIYSTETKLIHINNSKFINSTRGSVQFYSQRDTWGPYKAFINNSQFINSRASSYGGAIYTYYTVDVDNSQFINCSANQGGAIYFNKYWRSNENIKDSKISNSLFINNNANSHEGGAVYCGFESLDVINSSFINNSAKDNGGALYLESPGSGKYHINDNKFINNSAGLYGGVLYVFNIENSTLINNSYINNSAKIGGALFIDYAHKKNEKSNNVILDKSRFINNTAISGGAVILYSSNSTVSNSYFENNNATRYGGGALITGGENTLVINNSFIENNAFLYGGALCSNDSYIKNNTFINNTAYQAGAILAINSTIAYNTFLNNNATRGPNIVFVDNYDYITSTSLLCNCSDCIDCDCLMGKCNCSNATMSIKKENLLIDNAGLSDDSIYVYDENRLLRVANEHNGIYYLYKYPDMTSGEYYWKGYCIEKENSNPISYNGTYGILVEDLEFVRNSLDKSYVGDYIKVLVILYQKEIFNLRDYIYVFTDGDYKNSNDPIIKNVIKFTNDEDTILQNGFNWVNGTYSCYWFETFINPTTRQNLILINGCGKVPTPGIVGVKTANTTKVKKGDLINYTISVYNDKDVPLTNVTVRDILGTGPISFVKWENPLNDSWVQIGFGHTTTYLLKRTLMPGQMAKINIIANVFSDYYGFSFNNTIDVWSLEANQYVTSVLVESEGSHDRVTMIKENYGNTKDLQEGDIVSFLITVINNRTDVSGNVYVKDTWDMKKLGYLGMVSHKGKWWDSGVTVLDGKIHDSFYLVDDNGWYRGLNPGESASFITYFKILPLGLRSGQETIIINNAELFIGSNSVQKDDANISVHKPMLIVNKDVYGKRTVLVGENITFQIIVSTPYPYAPVREVYVEDIIPDNLQYLSFKGENWSYIRQGGVDRWIYSKNVTYHNAANPLYITCKALEKGQGTNYATVYGQNSDPFNSVKTPYYIIAPIISVSKITNNKTVYVGESVSFTIKVKNTGDVILHNVTVNEISYNSLIYDHYVDKSNKWIKTNQYSWIYNGTLDKGEESEFVVFFNTTKIGTAYNVVSATTNESAYDEASNNTTVIIRELTGEKITVDKVVNLGDNVTFTVKVINTFNRDISEIFVKEFDIDGLSFVGWINNTGNWVRENNLFKLNGHLSPTESASFNITFKAEKEGKFTNVIVYGSNQTKNFTASNDTFVRNYNMSVEKISLDKTAFTNEEIRFLIKVRNTGNMDLHHVFINEFTFTNLTYIGYSVVDGGPWRYVNTNGMHIFRLISTLKVNSSASIEVVFKTNRSGNYTNIVISGSDETKNQTVNNTTNVLNSKLSVEKITINPIVNLGDNVTFTIVVRNNGDNPLSDIVVREVKFDGLEFVKFASNRGIWNHEGNIFKLTGNLNPGDNASFNVTFKTIKIGNLTNIVVGSYNQSPNITANNTTFVIRPDMTIQKITLNSVVNLGDNVGFMIIVNNTGNVDLGNVTVCELNFNGLKYIDFISNNGNWIKSENIFKLNDVLKIGEIASFNITFKAEKYGNLTNVISARSNKTNEIFTNNSTYVRTPVLDVVKITLNRTVYIGQTATFEIIVSNNGDFNLTDVVVNEFKHDYLAYVGYINGTGQWINRDGAFYLVGNLSIGQKASFKVIFNTTKTGDYKNIVVAKSNQTENKTAENTTNVIEIPHPNVSISKIALNKIVNVGGEVVFRIVIKNTGNVDLNNIKVYENYPEGSCTET